MKIEKQIIVKISKEDRDYTFTMPENAPLGEVYDALFQALNEVVTVVRQSVDQAPVKTSQQNQGETNGTSAV